MDMMAMALLFDMASKNRRSDEQAERRSRDRTGNLAEHLIGALFRRPRPPARHGDCEGFPRFVP
ncbi:hypothetical protein [Sinorhizobium sp. NG07B]|uniref:Uncharacterized protein n=4 Tax=Sinorhizobium/Ensifer group TaxID=227292 RepID=A0A2S3YUA3_9HYPH|nr:hypothetical protein [Sinorhizobium sp. NG07B]AUX75300.1 hypothetical protein NXT3_CH00697 [Sinorhizobium fredii]PDT38930.1 hypothetical protein CO656_22895 [Sinorhizobium sp. FG01]POH25439.1 hypothetical protein ATY30_28090 [Sinorhizobium americanum]PDT51075.1 hypothetical protein CO664_23770 [Sinorhizobium sp. NG07B]POH35197.1 hypothetical protein ATY31_03840 [Sinorhizobium americanum]